MSVSLHKALRADRYPCIAFTGAGGKTTALFQLARSLTPPVIVTGTSHLGAWQVKNADRHIMTGSPAPLEELEHALSGVILVTGILDGDRTQPVNESLLAWLQEFCGYHAIPLLVEADGSRQKPLKAWAQHEPAIPEFAGLVVQVAGLSALGKPLKSDFVHRPEIFSRLSELPQGETITTSAITSLLLHPVGGLKNIPPRARRAVLLNQADTPELQAAGGGMVRPLLASYDSVLVASLKDKTIFAVHEPTAAILLAAGESSRYGKTKQLLDWHGQPFVRAVAKTALEAGCSPVIVVTGANAAEVDKAVNDLNVRIVHNADWKEGQASSIRAGLGPPPFLPQVRPTEIIVDSETINVGLGGGARRAEGVGSAIFLLADQPQITASILRALMEKHAAGLSPVVAPMIMDRRANPVLFDRVTFDDLVSLQGDVGGRAILHKYNVEYLPWHDERLLLDVDTPEMYQRLLSEEDL